MKGNASVSVSHQNPQPCEVAPIRATVMTSPSQGSARLAQPPLAWSLTAQQVRPCWWSCRSHVRHVVESSMGVTIIIIRFEPIN